jgi:nucleotide-binding universal stress UspA family protein
MTGQSRLVAGIDLGPETVKVVSYTALFAGAMHASVRLLYVIDYLLTPPSYLAEYIEEEKKREEAEVEIWKARLQESAVDADCVTVLGRLHESFLKTIKDTGPSLLVIGFSSHLFRPSSSERLIKSLRVPILVVKGKVSAGAEVGSVKVSRILCPVDFSENSKKAALAAKQYAALFTADLKLVHVIPSHHIREKRLLWKQLPQEDKEMFDDALRSEAEVKLASFCKEMHIEGEGAIYEGHPGEMIPTLAEEGRHDLIVIGARGLSYVERVLIGGTTEAVLKSSYCPVLIIH